MFARILRQNREIKEKFYNLISEKENNQKRIFLEKFDKNLFLKVLKPFANIWYTYELKSKKKKGDDGETDVSFFLWICLSRKAIIVNDVVLEVAKGEFIQIDHLIFHQKGIFVIETKNWNGALICDKDIWRLKVGNTWQEVSSPSKQNQRHVRLLLKWFENNLPERLYKKIKDYVFPVVVFPRANWIKVKNCSMPVFKGKLSLLLYIISQKNKVFEEQELTYIAAKVVSVKPFD